MSLLLIGCCDDLVMFVCLFVCLQNEDGVSASESRLDQSDGEDKENEPEDDDEEDDGGGWITPSNIKQVKMDSADWTAPADVRVGCLTTDFAMQVRDASFPSAKEGRPQFDS